MERFSYRGVHFNVDQGIVGGGGGGCLFHHGGIIDHTFNNRNNVGCCLYATTVFKSWLQEPIKSL